MKPIHEVPKAGPATLWSRKAVRASAALTAGVACVVAVLLGAGSSAAKPAPSARPAAVQQGGTLTVATPLEPISLDPSTGQSDNGSEETDIQIYDQLVENLPGSTKLVPGLAESWSTSPNGLVYTFHLRGARFSNGAQVTSSDVVFTWSLLLNPKHDTTGFATFFGFVKSVDAAGPTTVVFHLKRVTPAFLAYLSFPIPSILPKAYYEKVGPAGFARHPVGSGAFEFVSWQHGQQMVLDRNPYYWRTGEPHVTKLALDFVTSDNTRVLGVESGAYDIAIGLPYGQLASLQKASGIHVIIKQVTAVDPVVLNEHKSPLAELVVRQALNYATPRDEINRVVFANTATPENSSWGINKYWDSKVKPYPYDIQKAKQLLAKSTTPHGFTITLTVDGTDTPSLQTAEILQQAWAQIGVTVKIVQTDFGTLNSDLQAENFEAAMLPPTDVSSDVPTDDELVQVFLTSLGGAHSFYTYYNNPTVTKLIEQVIKTPSEATRRKLFAEIQQDSVTDPPFVDVVFAPTIGAVRSNIVGFDFVTTNWWRLDQVVRQG